MYAREISSKHPPCISTPKKTIQFGKEKKKHLKYTSVNVDAKERNLLMCR